MKLSKMLASLFVLVAVCYTEQDIKNSVCHAICRNDGYEDGFYIEAQKSCMCGDVRAYKEITSIKIKIPPTYPSNRPRYREDE